MKDVFEAKLTDRIIDTGDRETAESEGLNGTHVVTGHFEMGSQYHYTMETQTCVCVPSDDGMNIYSAAQWIDGVQLAVSNVLNVPQNKLNIEVRRVGGGYGSKVSRNLQTACAAALACHKLNRPIRFILTIEANMLTCGKRYACTNDYDVSVDDNGKIQKLSNNFYEDYGCTLNEAIADIIVAAFKNCYDNSTWNVTSKMIKTDAPSHSWCRAPGSTEALAMIENIIEHIARVVNKSPEDVRLANISSSNPLKKMYPDFLKSVGKSF